MLHSRGNMVDRKMPLSLSIIATKLWFKKIIAWCKKYWQILVGAAIPIVIMIVFRQRQDLDKVLQAAKDNHEKELDAINKSYEKEIVEREAAQKRYKDTISEIEKRFEEESSSLNSKKRKEIKKLLSDGSKSDEEITRRLSEITGFDIHVSE